MFDERLLNMARLLLDDAQQKRLKIATAESCTGGLLAGLLTEIPGSSKTLERGFVVYSNKAKQEMLDVPGEMLADFGAVSEPVARAMAEGALANSRANIAIGITGIAGPSGETAMKGVGLVHIAVARENRAILHRTSKFGDIGRSEVRRKSLILSMEMISSIMSDS